jgi:tRNA threonylcarbamoyl adenosine modification protein YeaZ
MKMLAVEFSSERRSVAVAVAGAAGDVVVLAEAASPDRHRGALRLVDEALRAARLEREAIECLVVGLGPGSYTGIRAAISLAQGWQLARGVRLLGVSSAGCVAAEAQARGVTGRVAVVIDAQRGEFYLAVYDLGPGERQVSGALKLASRAEVEAEAVGGARLIGPEVTNWFAGAGVIHPQAGTLARLAAGRSDFVPGEKLEPVYLRETTFVKAPPSRSV